MTGPNAGGAFGPGTSWSLVMDGDSYTSPWTLQNGFVPFDIVSFSIDGAAGRTVFDIVSGSDRSPGSADGNPFGGVDGPAGVTFAAATYTNQLLVGGTFYGDTYTRLDVALTGGLAAGQSLTFFADTDNADANGITPVPEPASFALLGVALVAMGTVRRRP